MVSALSVSCHMFPWLQEAQQQQETRQVEPEPAEELPPGWEKHEGEPRGRGRGRREDEGKREGESWGRHTGREKTQPVRHRDTEVVLGEASE